MKPNAFEKGKTFSYANSISYADNAIVSKQVLKQQAGNISLFAFDKGEGLAEHKTPFDAVALIVEGQAEIIIDGISNVVRTGECIIMPANIPHALNASEKFKMVLTMIKSTS